MTNAAAGFSVNTYSYMFDGPAAGTVARLADQGYGAVELMFFPGHLWPAELDAASLRSLVSCVSFDSSRMQNRGAWRPTDAVSSAAISLAIQARS